MLGKNLVKIFVKNTWLLLCVHIRFVGFVEDSGMHARIHTCLQKSKDHPITMNIYVPLYEPHL